MVFFKVEMQKKILIPPDKLVWAIIPVSYTIRLSVTTKDYKEVPLAP